MKKYLIIFFVLLCAAWVVTMVFHPSTAFAVDEQYFVVNNAATALSLNEEEIELDLYLGKEVNIIGKFKDYYEVTSDDQIQSYLILQEYVNDTKDTLIIDGDTYVYDGDWKVTGYISGEGGHTCCHGKRLKGMIDEIVATNCLPQGTEIFISGIGTRYVCDTGTNGIDVLCTTRSECLNVIGNSYRGIWIKENEE